MAEIKSTIDLVMEKTKELKLTEEERKALEAEELQKTAQAMVRRFLHGELSIEEMERKAVESSEGLREALLGEFIQRLDLSSTEFFPILEALERLGGKELGSTLRKLKDLSMNFGHALHRQRKKIKAQLWEELSRRGISGSAVEPNVDASPLWERAVRDVALEFTHRLEPLKEALLRHSRRSQ
jgi:hypothetical protein